VSINDRYARLLARRAPAEERVLQKSIEAYEDQAGTNTKYILGAITPVNAKRTQRLEEQGNRVENQLQVRLASAYPGVVFKRQGSVSNNTHIRYYSDVDVLVLIDKFYDLEPPQTPTVPYTGNPIEDLKTLRASCARELGVAFPAAEVDDSGSTCVSISGASLVCRVDVVPASWYNTVSYSGGGGSHTRGVMVFNRPEGKRKPNYPFLFNFRLHERDGGRNGVPRMLIRLLKTLKADSEEESSRLIEFSSFDICSLLYRMPDNYLQADIRMPLDIVRNVLFWIYAVLNQQDLVTSLKVIDDSRLIFDKTEKVGGLRRLQEDLLDLYSEAVKEQGGYTMLSEAHLR
jgi:hypothetical protein